MASIAGTLEVGEARGTGAAIAARLYGSRGSYFALLLALLTFGVIIGLSLSGLFAGGSAADYELGGVLGIGCGAAIFLFVRRPIMTARLKRSFQARRQPMELPLRVEVTPEHLLSEVGGMTAVARWSAVSEILRSRGYWIFMAQAAAIFAPRRLFADEHAEKAFLREALAQMSEDARKRSAEAVRFSEFSAAG